MKRSRPLFLALACVLSAMSSAAQVRIVGTVADSAAQGIAYANVALLTAADTSLVAFASTSDGGAFALRLDEGASGDYLLRVTFVGYRAHEQTVTIAPGARLLDLDAVTLHPQGYLLGGVEVSGYRIPIRMRGDTVVFDADAFATGPHAVVEDLLRRLPGLSVEAGGVLRYHGRPISEVMVNGRPFFRGNTQLLTQNLDAAAVEDVEVYDRKSASEIVSGEDDGREDLTVNLTIKEEAEGTVFGEVYGGLGTSARYRAGGKAFRIRGASQIGAVATANNLNETGLSYGDLRGLGLSGANTGGPGGISPARGGGQVVGDNRTLAGGLNFGTPCGKTANATLSYLVYDVDERLEALHVDRFADPGRGRTTVARADDNRRYLHQVSADLERQADTSSWLVARVDGRLAGRRRRRTSAVDFARPGETSGYRQRDHGREWLPGLDASLDYSQRLGASGLVLGLNTRASLGRDRDRLDSEVEGEAAVGPVPDGGALDWSVDARTMYNGGRVGLRYELGARWTVTPSLGYAFSGTRTTSAATSTTDVAFRSAYTLLQPGVRLRRQLEAGHYSLGFVRHALDWRLSGDLARRTRRAYWAPHAELALEPGEGRLHFSLSAQPEVPRATELLAVPDPRDVGRIRIGSPALDPSFAYRLSGRYLLFHPFSGFSLVGNAQLAHVDAPVGYALDLRGAVPMSRAANFEFLRKQQGYLRVGQRLGPVGMKTSVEGTLSRETGPGALNGELTDYARMAWALGGRLERAVGEDGFVALAYRYGRRESAYASGETRVAASTRRLSVQAEAPLSGRLRAESTFGYAVFGAGDAVTRLPSWDAAVEYQVWAHKPHSLRLAATDLLDQNRGVEQEALGFAVRETRASVLGRVVTLEARWRL